MLFALALILLSTLIILVVLEQARFQVQRRQLPGPRWVIPFIGNLIPFANDPLKFFSDAFKRGDVSWDYMLGQFFYFFNDASSLKKIMKEQGGTFTLLGAPALGYLLSVTKVLPCLPKASHAALRKTLNPVFTRRYLVSHLPNMEKVVEKHLKSWIAECEQTKTITLVSRSHDLTFSNTMVAFVGSRFAENPKHGSNFRLLAESMAAAPVCLPGFKLWSGVQARRSLLEYLKQITKVAKSRAENGDEPESIVDYWIKSLHDSKDGDFRDGRLDVLIVENILGILFASQDTTASTITWFFALMSDHPDVLAKIREEQKLLRPNGEHFTEALLNQMKYTSQVVKEVLRYRNPLPVAGFVANKHTEISGVKVNKGTAVFANFDAPLFSDDFTDPHKFDPDRFGAERREHVFNAKNNVPFGVGAYRCLGNNFAEIFILLTAAVSTASAEWRRVMTDKSERVVMNPLRIPADGCVMTIGWKEKNNAK